MVQNNLMLFGEVNKIVGIYQEGPVDRRQRSNWLIAYHTVAEPITYKVMNEY